MRVFLPQTSIFLALALPALPQEPIAPTPQTTASAAGKNIESYNVVQSFELGVRFHEVAGNIGKYRSDVNYGDGVRLLSSSLTVNSRDGHGALFDEIVLKTQGLGNDPYESAAFRVQKNGLYRYDLLWRSDEFYNPALTIAGGSHFWNLHRRMQDHDLVLLPQSRYRLLFGYSRNVQDGPGLSTLHYPSGGDLFTDLVDMRRSWQDYRIGVEAEIGRAKLTIVRGWEGFKEDARFSIAGLNEGANTGDRITITALRRDQPYHGDTGYWRATAQYDKHRLFSFNGRFTSAHTRRNSISDEGLVGTDRFGRSSNLQFLLFGSGSRPATTGNVTISLFPNEAITVTNHTSYYSIRLEGQGTFSQLTNNEFSFSNYNFERLGLRTVSNLTDLNARIAPWLYVYSGYHFSARRTAFVATSDEPPAPRSSAIEQVNHVHAGLVGFRVLASKKFRLSGDAEIGRSDHPFYTTSDKDYHALTGRAQWKNKKTSLSAAFKTFFNANTTSFFAYSSRGRNSSIDGTLSPKRFVTIDAGYANLHINSLTGIAYFSLGKQIGGDKSYYVSNLHSLHAGISVSVAKRADIYAGFQRVQDTGDGRSTPAGSSRADVIQNPNLATGFLEAQVFPLTYQSPSLRLSLPLRRKLRWNAGYQYYGYSEKFLRLQGYRAHTGYSSLTWSF